jgi:hypothetical protein
MSVPIEQQKIHVKVISQFNKPETLVPGGPGTKKSQLAQF